MPDELEAIPVNYNPWSDPRQTLSAGAGVLPETGGPTQAALETGAKIQQDRFSLAPEQTSEGLPYYQTGSQPSFPEPGSTAAVPPTTAPPTPLVLSTHRSPYDEFINTHAARAGVDANLMRRIMQIESSGDPNSRTGSYRGLFQLSPQEFQKWGGTGSIYNPEANTAAAANKLAAEGRAFRERYGREPTATDSYLLHQQGEGGYANHLARPDQPAWLNMYHTAEGQQKGPLWAQRAIWGNLPASAKSQFGSVQNVTSRDFVNLWRNKVEGGQMAGGQFSGEQALPLPGQSRGLGPTAGPTVTSTMAAEDIPPPVTHGDEVPLIRNPASNSLTGIHDLSRLVQHVPIDRNPFATNSHRR